MFISSSLYPSLAAQWHMYGFYMFFCFRCIPICLTSFLPLPFLKLPFLKLLRMDAKLSCLLTCLPTFPPPSRDSGFRVKDFLSADLHQFFVFILSSHGTVGAFCLGCFHKEFWSVSCLGGFCSKCSLFVSHFFVGVWFMEIGLKIQRLSQLDFWTALGSLCTNKSCIHSPRVQLPEKEDFAVIFGEYAPCKRRQSSFNQLPFSQKRDAQKIRTDHDETCRNVSQ